MTDRIHRIVDGPPDAPPVVLVNSLGSTLAMWDALAAALAGPFRVIRYDLRGHGGSPSGPRRDLAMRDLAADLAGLLDELGIARAAVVGLSLGGMIAMQLALDAPGRVGRLVLSNTSACLGAPGAWTARADLVTAEGMDAVADAVAARWLTPEYAAAHPERLAELRAMIASTDPAGYAACCRAIEAMDLTGELGTIRAPTLVISGDRDPAIPRADIERIVRSIPGASHEEVDDAAHLPNLEHPDRYAELVAAHLAPLLDGAVA